MQLYVRADADARIGTGHVMRCIALAQAWQDRGEIVTFISHCESEALQERIIKEGFEFVYLEKAHPAPFDLERTLSLVTNKINQPNLINPTSQPNVTNATNLCWLVLDGYHFSPDYQKAIRNAGIPLLVIDDMNHLPHYHADILLNQNIHAPDLKYRCDEDTTLLLGTQYVLLRREFLKYRDFERQIPGRAKNILVTLGGADPDNVSLKVIKALNLIGDPNIEVRIAIGPANQNIEKLKKELALSPCTFHLLHNVSNMPELMAWADLAISAGGSTCWELAFMGVPSIILILGENQATVSEYLMNKKVAVNLGFFAECTKERISRECRSLIQDSVIRKSLSERSRALTNGQGSSLVMESIKRRSFSLRDVTDLDRELIWHWTNDKETRKASYSRVHISWEEHIRWFDSVHRKKNHRFYIASNESKNPVGQIRFAIDGKDAVVSFSVAPESRRRGYGKKILIKAAKKLFDETNIEQISAYVKFENMPSLKVFHNAGFRVVEEVDICGVKSIKMILNKTDLL
ncbi:MAG: UDP-2,4-diacetamido-2,4,6-trideoxy-beta-L-altropyranose hydrolase [Syntrophales bacterium]